MRVVEEILLLLLSKERGFFEPIPAWNLSSVVAGAILADLVLERRIGTVNDSMILIDATTTGDDLLDQALAQIANEKEEKGIQYWVETGAHRCEGTIDCLLERLVAQEILDYDPAGYWSFSRSVASSRGKDERASQVRSRTLSALIEIGSPNPRDAILIDLAYASDALHHLMSAPDYEKAQGRIERIHKMEIISAPIAEAVRETCKRQPKPSLVSKDMPTLGLWDILKSSTTRRHLVGRNIARLMAQTYRAKGGVFELKLPFGRERMVALVGQTANHWVDKRGRSYLYSKDSVSDLESLFGAAKSLFGMDGAEHFRLRRSLREAHSQASLASNIDQLIVHCRSALQDWTPGKKLKGTKVCQLLTSRQVSHLAFNIDTSEYIQDVLDYLHRALSVRGLRVLPESTLRTSTMRRKRERLLALLDRVHAQHARAPDARHVGTLAQEYLRIHAQDPELLPRSDLNLYFLATLMKSIYVGNSLAFAISAMTSHPDVYQKIKAEGDALFSQGNPRAQDLTRQAFDTAYRLVLETQRLFPVIPVQVRRVMNPCIIEGHEIRVGTRILSAHAASHFLDEYFPDPLNFDIDRFGSERETQLKPYAYAPFGLGTHKCLAADSSSLQTIVNILLIAHHLELTSRPSSYDLKINPFPCNAPSKHYSIRVKEVRNRLPA